MAANPSVENIINNIRRIFQAFNDYSKRANMEAGLTGPQLWAIKMISEHAPLRVCDLAALMFIRPGTVVGILDRLEKKGLVTRIRSQLDRRAVMIDLSEQGRALVAGAPGVIQGDLVRGLETLPEQELRAIDASMARLVGILGVQQLPPEMIHGLVDLLSGDDNRTA
jgi:DNA-binding MarR family transcriptional regulator